MESRLRDVVPKFDGAGNAQLWLALFEEAAQLRACEGDVMWRAQYRWPKRAVAFFEGEAALWVGTVTSLLSPSEVVVTQVNVLETDFNAKMGLKAEKKEPRDVEAWCKARAEVDEKVADLTKEVWKSFRTAFVARFAPVRGMAEVSWGLMDMRPKSKESDRSFADRLLKAVQEVPGKDVQWSTLARVLVKHQTQAVRIHFTAAVNLCQSVTLFETLVAELIALKRGEIGYVEEGGVGSVGAATGQGVSGQGGMQSGRGGGSVVRRCYTCNQIGHLQNRCPLKNLGPVSTSGTRAGGTGVVGAGRGVPMAAIGNVQRGGAVASRGGAPGRGGWAGRARGPCYRCGEAGHTAVGCRASAEAADAYRAKQQVERGMAAMSLEGQQEEQAVPGQASQPSYNQA